MNKIQLIGRLGADPKLSHTTAGKACCRFSLATTERWNDAQGQRQEQTEWHNIVVWGKLAEPCNRFLRKGLQVYVEGRATHRKYQDQGAEREIYEVVVRDVEFLQFADDGSAPAQQRQAQPQQQRARGGGRAPSSGGGGGGAVW